VVHHLLGDIAGGTVGRLVPPICTDAGNSNCEASNLGIILGSLPRGAKSGSRSQKTFGLPTAGIIVTCSLEPSPSALDQFLNW
jgi:hypothetical protein